MTEYEFSATIKHFTDKAVLVDDGIKQLWIPRSLILSEEQEFELEKTYDLIVPAWFAEKEDLV